MQLWFSCELVKDANVAICFVEAKYSLLLLLKIRRSDQLMAGKPDIALWFSPLAGALFSWRFGRTSNREIHLPFESVNAGDKDG